MDSKDKKIINSLFDDARMSVAEIEKKTKIRRDSVARRLKKMINEKTILGFSPIINPSSLGYPNISLLLLKTKTGNDSQKEKFLNKLTLVGNSFENSLEVIAATITTGEYLFAKLFCKTKTGLFPPCSDLTTGFKFTTKISPL